MTFPIGYYLPDGTWIAIPRLPLERAGLVPPCEVTKPDGTVVLVVERKDAPASCSGERPGL